METPPTDLQAEMSADLIDPLAAGEVPSAPGALILTDVRDFIRRFCVLPGEAELTAITLWVAHTHIVEHLYITPRLAVLSPEPGSGKTRVLEIVGLLVTDPMLSLSASSAAIFRSLAKRQMTLLFDEIDAIWGGRGKDDGREDLRALINAGYKRGATIPRCVGRDHDVTQFPAFGPVALAGLDELPNTIMSRSLIIRMRPRAADEYAAQYRSRQNDPEGNALRDRLAAWLRPRGPQIGEVTPKLPPGVEDRPAELWEGLIAIADAAGGEWPQRARDACQAMCLEPQIETASQGVRLLRDLRTVFGDRPSMHTKTILDALNSGVGLDEDAPWGTMNGCSLDPRTLAKLLRPYGVKSEKVTIDGKSLQGYQRSALLDTWLRYLEHRQLPKDPECPEST